MTQEQDAKINQTIDKLIREKLYIDAQTEELLKSLYNQYNAEDPFQKLGKMFDLKNKKIQTLTAKNKQLLEENRRLKHQLNHSQLNLSYPPQLIQGGMGTQLQPPNQKMSQSLIQKGSLINNSSVMNQTQHSLGSQIQKQGMRQVSEMIGQARSQEQTYSRYNDSFLIHLIQMISKLSTKRNQEKRNHSKQPNDQRQNRNGQEEQIATVNIPVQNYKRLIEAYCVYMAEKSTTQIIPKQIKSNEYSNMNVVNYKQLLKNLKMQSADNFQSIFAVISAKLGLSEEWKNFIYNKQEQYTKIYQSIGQIVDKKLCQNLHQIKSQGQRTKKAQEQQLFDKLSRLVDLDCLKFTKRQKQIWDKHNNNRNWLDLQFFLGQVNKSVDTKLISQIFQQFQQNMFKKCLATIFDTIYQTKISSKHEKVQKINDQEYLKKLDTCIGHYIEKLTQSPKQKEEYLKIIFKLQDQKFEIARKFLQKDAYFYTGVNPEYQFRM